ncbi:MAG: hypothetical protein AAF921_10545 [Cyanobacteria bacterium P01_D01_bin.44]
MDFGGDIEREGTFSGYTIPTQVRGGWHFGTERFKSEGKFCQAMIDEVTYK